MADVAKQQIDKVNVLRWWHYITIPIIGRYRGKINVYGKKYTMYFYKNTFYVI